MTAARAANLAALGFVQAWLRYKLYSYMGWVGLFGTI
jgi:hypothetical protein